MKKIKILLTSILLMVILFFVTSPLIVRQGSMENLYHNNDIVFVNRFFKNIQRGDIVGFKKGGKKHIKRCVGVPGDTILIKKNKLYVNNHLMTWETQKLDTSINTEPMGKKINDFYFNDWTKVDFGPFVVPKKSMKYEDKPYYRNLILKETYRETGSSFHKDYFFILGDNRPSSIDSREYGPISHDEIIGKVYFDFNIF